MPTAMSMALMRDREEEAEASAEQLQNSGLDEFESICTDLRDLSSPDTVISGGYPAPPHPVLHMYSLLGTVSSVYSYVNAALFLYYY